MFRNLVRLIAVSALVLSLTACSKGDDGKDFLSLDWAFTPLAGNFPQLPNPVVANTAYPITAGTYTFTYTAWDSSNWVGTFEATVNKGKDGFPKGDKGADKTYSVYLGGALVGGPSLSGGLRNAELAQANTLPQGAPSQSLSAQNGGEPLPAVTPDGDWKVESVEQGPWILTLRSKQQ